MERITLPGRPDWQQKANEIGFTYHSLGLRPQGEADGLYWFEEAAYRFTAQEVDHLEAATEELHRLCMRAVQHVVESDRSQMDRFGIPAAYRDLVIHSWERHDPHLMGRFDLAFDSITGHVKMLEYNADTPTLLIESSLMQWFWLQDVFPEDDQFNSLHEKLIARLETIKARMPSDAVLHVSGLETADEEFQHCKYFIDLADKAGIDARFIDIRNLRWTEQGRFIDDEPREVRFLHKLYPWEWLVKEPFGIHLTEAKMALIEPPWKMLLSNKALLPLLWQMNRGHPLLLASGWSRDDVGEAFVQKPILAREGANMRMVRPGFEDVVTGGSYGDSPTIYQDLAPIPIFEGQHVVLGSWVVGDEAAGIIVRESENPIVVNTSRVVPHLFS